jgi:hypothetical protein
MFFGINLNGVPAVESTGIRHAQPAKCRLVIEERKSQWIA